ncbi:LacI family DNA-binding transcriptional regulator [Microbacterium sp. SLBN-154]|uniref:LacI family DNA-binding transcriptional regulator n=1 Tax=Microbacterium sp. SLBN-154 TaxID=2768458 RepID=UPI0013590875|nr:LacI family DNA-binding transcriptional regulator [Microbacterium sp. SLBN-154]
MATVHDVAALAGVSIATVSRALREPHRVSDATRERVMSAVRATEYSPNRSAIGLRTGRTGSIALVVPDVTNPYFSALTRGAQAAARESGFGLFVVDTQESTQLERAEITSIRSHVDGVLLASARLSDDELEDLVDSPTPIVLLNRLPRPHWPVAGSVVIDESAGARLAMDHLHALGHRAIAYVGGPANAWSEVQRRRAMERAASAYPDLSLVTMRVESPDASGGRALGPAALADGPTAVVAFNDLVALGLMSDWAERGVSVPGDVSLLGHDNTFTTGLSNPHLSSIGVDPMIFGAHAIDALAEAVVRKRRMRTPGSVVSLPPTLHSRESTAQAARGGGDGGI